MYRSTDTGATVHVQLVRHCVELADLACDFEVARDARWAFTCYACRRLHPSCIAGQQEHVMKYQQYRLLHACAPVTQVR